MVEKKRFITVKEYFDFHFPKIFDDVSKEKFDKELAFLYLGYYELFRRDKLDMYREVGNDNWTDPLFISHYIDYEIKKEKISYTKQEIIEEGRKYFDNLKNRLFKIICIDFEYCKRSASFTVADTLSSIITVSSNLPLGISMIVVKSIVITFDRFCHCRW